MTKRWPIMMTRWRLPALTILASAYLASACTLGPDYVRPQSATPPAYKESAGWIMASPQDAIDRGAWWSVFQDAALDELERQIDISNQTLRAAEAAWRAANALASQTAGGQLPTLKGGLLDTREGGERGQTRVQTEGHSLTATADWTLDLWGRIRRLVESDRATAAASAADLAAARLSAQASLATHYFNLRATDAASALLTQAVAAYARSLAIITNQYDAGIATTAEIATARTQLEQTRSRQIATAITRARYEHAIALLVGRAPADFALAPAPLARAVPIPPPGIPSTLLQRRPDIAAAERRMAAANALVGAAETAWYPALTLSGAATLSSAARGPLFAATDLVWSLGEKLSQSLLGGGDRAAASEQARATYDQAQAKYQQTVLAAFGQVEDQLVTLRVLEQQAIVQDQATASAAEAERLLLNRYQAGTIAYTSVVTAQQTALSNQETSLTLQRDRLTGAVALIQALGGGWSSDELP